MTPTRSLHPPARALQVHAMVFALGVTVIVLVNLLTNLQAGIVGDWSAWWSLWAVVGWGTGLGVHAVGVHAVVVLADGQRQAGR